MEHDTHQPDVFTASEAYARRFAGPVGRWMLDVQAQVVRELLIDEPELDVLELGGGHGQLTGHLLAWGHRVCVQGSDASCARRVAGLIAAHQPRARFVASDLWSLPFADHSFDVCIAVRVLAHVERWGPLLAEMARVTRRQILVDFPPLRGLHVLAPWLAGLKGRLEPAARPYFSYRTQALVEQFRQLGFEHVRWKGQFFWPMVLHRALHSRRLSVMLEAAARRMELTDRFGGPVLLSACRGGCPG